MYFKRFYLLDADRRTQVILEIAFMCFSSCLVLLAEKSGCPGSSSAMVWIMQALALIPDAQDWLCLLGWKRPKGYRGPPAFERQQQSWLKQHSAPTAAASSSLQCALCLHMGLETSPLPALLSAPRSINQELNYKHFLIKNRRFQTISSCGMLGPASESLMEDNRQR